MKSVVAVAVVAALVLLPLSLSLSVQRDFETLQDDVARRTDVLLEAKADPCMCSSDAKGAYRPNWYTARCNYWGESYKWCYVIGGEQCVGSNKGSGGHWVRCNMFGPIIEKPKDERSFGERALESAKNAGNSILNIPKTVSTYAERVAKTVRVGSVVVYGKWCGPRYSGGANTRTNGGPGSAASIDSLDRCCEVHDRCYGSTVYHNCACDKAFVHCVRAETCANVADKFKCRDAKQVMDWYFTSHQGCTCATEGNVEKRPPFAYEHCTATNANGSPAAIAPGWVPTNPK